MTSYASVVDRRDRPGQPVPTAPHAAPGGAGAAVRYAFRIVPKRHLLHIAISGFWTTDTVADFAYDVAIAIAALETEPGRHLICCDVSDAAIQPQEVVAAFQHLILHGPAKARRMALFTTGLRARMQSRRIVALRDTIAIFETEAAALAWLVAEDAGA